MELDERINFIARDKDGSLWGYEEEPYKTGIVFGDICIKRHWTSKYGLIKEIKNLTKDDMETLKVIKWENEKATEYNRNKKMIEEKYNYNNCFDEIMLKQNLKNIKIKKLEKENMCLSDNNNTLLQENTMLKKELNDLRIEYLNSNKITDKFIVNFRTYVGVSSVIIDKNNLNTFINQLKVCDINIDSITNFRNQKVN